MLLKNNSFSKKYCYGLEISSFKVNGEVAEINAISFTVSKGLPTIAIGSLYTRKVTSFEEFKESFHLTMNPLFKWNGKNMWSLSNLFAEEMDAWKQLDTLYQQAVLNGTNIQEPDLSLVLGNYEGWFARL